MFSMEQFRRQVDIERIRGHIRALEGVRHPLTAPAALEKAADYVGEQLAMLGYEVAEQPFPDNGRSFRNVIGTSRGRKHRNERVLVLAHYDTVAGSPGADDNASGVAVLLEVATLLASLNFERTVQFVGVALEENASEDPASGTRGSLALAAHARASDWDIAGIIVLESVAYAGERVAQGSPPGVPVPVPATGDFLAVVGNERSRQLVDGFSRILEWQELALPHVALVVPGNGESLPDSRRSDHAPFWDAGYRAVMLTDTTNFRNPHYHGATDLLETLNLEFAAKVCTATCGFVTELAGSCP